MSGLESPKAWGLWSEKYLNFQVVSWWKCWFRFANFQWSCWMDYSGYTSGIKGRAINDGAVRAVLSSARGVAIHFFRVVIHNVKQNVRNGDPLDAIYKMLVEAISLFGGPSVDIVTRESGCDHMWPSDPGINFTKKWITGGFSRQYSQHWSKHMSSVQNPLLDY